ncbi:unnamed protein product [Prorocentrum cordatum]|uniref:RNA-directed RNA polymerase n=1 Tax=Prorocentrum cordatum TaxID=2364126 RepID=A0ABN9STN7_9DINO|nr:unnamed protein product [Polarella glacialis]
MPLKPIVMMEHTFVTDLPSDMVATLTVYHQELGMVLALVVGEKGPIQCALRKVIEYLGHWGRKATVSRVDGEPATEDRNEEVKDLRRTTGLLLRDVAEVELHAGHPLVPWLVRHCGWCICVPRVRTGGRTGYERLKGGPCNGKTALFGLPMPRPGRNGASITKAYLDKYGLTPECPGCTGRTTGHSDACKARFLEIWRKAERVIGALHACGQPPLAEAGSIVTPAAHVATPDVGTQDVKDHKTGEVPMKDARGKKVRSLWLDGKPVQDGETTVWTRCVAMEFNVYDRLGTYTATPPLKVVKLIASRAGSIRRPGTNDWTRVLGLYDIVTAFWPADLPLDEPITVIPPRGEEAPGMVRQMVKAMYGTRRASQLFLEFLVKVFEQCGYKALKTSRQIFYSRRYDSVAGLWGDDIIAEAESEGIDHLDAMISPLCNIKDLKHVVMLLESTGKLRAKPQGSPCSKQIGRDDPATLDELDGEAQTQHRSDTGRVLHVSSGRFDIQYSAKELGEPMSTPRRLGSARLDRCARYLAGCPFLALVFEHEPETATGPRSWTVARPTQAASSWARISSSPGPSQALSGAEAELYGIVDGAARGIITSGPRASAKRSRIVVVPERHGRVGSDASAAVGISSRSGVGKTRHIATRWLWVQDAVWEKQVILKKIPGETNIADLGTKALEPKRHQELMKLLPLAKPTCRRLLAAWVAFGAAPATQAAPEAQEELTCAVKPQCEDTRLLNYMLVALLNWGLVRL